MEFDHSPDLIAAAAPAAKPAAGAPAKTDTFWGADGFTFADLLDVINPLQHLPLISSLYRRITGDEISEGARLAGGTLFGGPIGIVTAMANLALEKATGKDIGETMLAAFDPEPEQAPVQFAAAASAQPNPAPANLPALRRLPARAMALPASASARPTLRPVATPLARPAAWLSATPKAPGSGLPMVGGLPPVVGGLTPGDVRQTALKIHDLLQKHAVDMGRVRP